MKRIALASLVLGLFAGTAAAQSGSFDAEDQITHSSERVVILRGIRSEPGIETASADFPERLSRIPEDEKAGDAGSSLSCDHCHKGWRDCCCGGCGWTLFGDYLLLHPRGSDPVFALRSPNCSSPPVGVEQIDFGVSSGFRVGLAKALCPGVSEIAMSYAHFEANDGQSATADIGSVLRPTLTVPLPPSCDDATSFTAAANASINFDRASVDYRRYVQHDCLQLDWLVGFSYGQLTQDIKATFDTATVSVDSGLWGYGLHLGGGGEYRYDCIRAFGHIDLTLLASNAKAHFKQIDAVGVTGEVANFEQNLDRIVPVLDLEVGVAVDLTNHTTFKIGYMYSWWFNVVTVPDFVEAVQKGDVTGDVGSTLSFDGLFARFEVTW